MAAANSVYVRPEEVSDGYHIPSGRKVFRNEGRPFIMNIGYSDSGEEYLTISGMEGKGTPYRRPDSSTIKPTETTAGQTKYRQPAPISPLMGGGLPNTGGYTDLSQTKYRNPDGSVRDVNIVNRGQTATLNGQPVIADGSGNWLDHSDRTQMMSEKPKVGKYSKGDQSRSTKKPKSKKPGSSALPSLKPGDDILAEDYPDGTPKPGTPVPTPNPAPNPTPTPTYNAKERVEKYGVKKAEDMAMMEWAKAHKGLAEKVKPGQAGYDAIQLALGKTTVEPEDIRSFMDDSGKSAEEARAILGGGSVETVIDGDKPMVTTINQPTNQKGAEAFKNFAIGALQGLDIGKYKELEYNPFDINAPALLDGALQGPDIEKNIELEYNPFEINVPALLDKPAVGQKPYTVPPEDIPKGEAALKKYLERLEAGELTGPNPLMK